MEYITTTLGNLVHQTAFFSLTWGNVIMIAVACFFLFLAIRHGFEPLLLVPIAFGMLLVNIYPDIMLSPEEASNGTGGLLYYFYVLDEWSIFPSLIFLGVGAMTDFGPLIANPKSFLLGAAAQFGIFAAYLGAMVLGFSDKARPLFPLSEELTDRRLSSWQESFRKRRSWVRSRWRHIRTCLLYPLSSRRS